MSNNVKLELTEDELILVQTALKFNLLAYEKHLSNGGNLDFQNKKVHSDMKALWNKFENRGDEYENRMELGQL